MDSTNTILETMQEDGWELLARFLPEGWREKARELGAFRRSRSIKDPETLLRVLLIHLADGCSLRETCVRAREGELACISAPSLQHRLESASEWLRWLAQGVRSDTREPPEMPRGPKAYTVRIVDGSSISEPGSTGTDWRVHYSLQLPSLRCDGFRVTVPKKGEHFSRHEVTPGDLLIGDRGYCHEKGIQHVVSLGGQVLVRINWQGIRIESERGKPFPVLTRGRALRIGRPREWPARVVPRKGDGKPVPGRVVGIRKSRAATLQARKRIQRRCSRNGTTPGRRALALAAYIFVFTTVPATHYSAGQILELYRARWQVEIAFKRLKSILGLGHLPKASRAAAEAWLHGKLLVAFLAEAIIAVGESISPWGYCI